MDAKGPVYGRHHAELLAGDQDMYLQVCAVHSAQLLCALYFLNFFAIFHWLVCCVRLYLVLVMHDSIVMLIVSSVILQMSVF